jgi:hypothetical protein
VPGPTFPGSIEGVVGVIRWKDYNAAAIHGYIVSFARDTGRWSLSALVVDANAFKLSMRPLVFVARTKTFDMEWPIDAFEFTGLRGPLTARLGSPTQRRRL